MTDAQIQAACAEAKAVGLRTWVHAHSPSSVRAATLAGCTTVTHGSQVDRRELKLMQEHGTYFEPNIGLVSQNYLENKSRYFGIGNFNEEGFAFTEKGIPMKREMFKRALTVSGLKLLMGTDAGAGAHGRSAEEIIYRVQVRDSRARRAPGCHLTQCAVPEPRGSHRIDRARLRGGSRRRRRRPAEGHHGAAPRRLRHEGGGSTRTAAIGELVSW
jgi:hypothetical protein